MKMVEFEESDPGCEYGLKQLISTSLKDLDIEDDAVGKIQ